MSLILIVDDDKDMLNLTERWIAKAGHEPIAAVSGQEAMEALGMIRPDLIVLDYYMPEMDGPAVCEAIRADDRYKNIPVVFRTGRDDEGFDEVMSRLHPDGIVSKDEGKAGLMDAIEKILQTA